MLPLGVVGVGVQIPTIVEKPRFFVYTSTMSPIKYNIGNMKTGTIIAFHNIMILHMVLYN